MINSIGIKNFRSLKNLENGDKDCLELKPITILLGKNSSGKSSFLRTFPLLKQSVTSRTRGALALFGDEVDFGDFETTISSDSLRDEKNAFIEFHFKGELPFGSLWSSYFQAKKSNKIKKMDVVYKVKSNDLLEILYVSDFNMKIGENEYSFSVNSDHVLTSLKVNGNEFINEMSSLKVDDSGIVPCFPLFVDRNGSLYKQLQNFLGLDKEEYIFSRWENLNIISSIEILKKILSTEKKIENFFRDKNICKILIEKKDGENFIDEFYNRIQLFIFDHLYRRVVNDLVTNFSAISYSKPLRANADRYYRSRFLSSNEVNSDGSNLVDFYNCLEKEKRNALNQWMKDNFGFFYTIESSQGHKSIFIHEEDKAKNKSRHNITDMGFGYSQILPIATQLWTLQNGVKKNIYNSINYIYAIEQPELHLHPAMQCRLINALAKIPQVADKNGIKISFIVETHSETMVNQLGKLIDRGDLSHEDVSVLIFSKEENVSSFTKIQQSKFNEHGELSEWPIGFFGEDA